MLGSLANSLTVGILACALHIIRNAYIALDGPDFFGNHLWMEDISPITRSIEGFDASKAQVVTQIKISIGDVPVIINWFQLG